MLHQIFKPFVQVDDSAAREYQGLGLGLAIAQSLVRLLGGEGIHIESEPDKGSCFAFTLPFEVWRGEARGGREKRRGREGEIVGGEGERKVEGEGGSGREVLEGGFGDNGGGRGKRARIVEERLDAGEEVGGGMWGEVQGGEWGEEGSDEMEEERGKNRGEGRGGVAIEPLSHDPEVQAQGHGPAPPGSRWDHCSYSSAVAGASSLRSSQGANAATEGRAAVAVGAAAVSTETSNAHQATGAGRHGVVVGSEAVNRSVLQPVAAAATAPTAAAVAGVATVTRGNKAGPAGTAGAGKTGAGLKCLVVDDNAVNRSVLQRLLRSLGAEQLVLARNGAEAVAVCEKDGEGLDVVFMDLHMPVMDGFEASTRILGLWRSRYGSDAVPRTSSMSQQQQQQVQAVQPLQPQQVQLQQQDYSFRYRPLLVAITASALEEEEEKCRKVGMDFFLTKPALLSEVASLSF
ncbi:unnamed protein product [Closterium sp. Naga37s-1]|nr:unnamed protein product [Closterium sp. Naga37s-1]